MFSCIIAKHAVFENLVENIRSRQLVSYPFILLSMVEALSGPEVGICRENHLWWHIDDVSM
jgi:hypothetical protein